MLAAHKAVPEESSCFIRKHFQQSALICGLLEAVAQEGLSPLCEVTRSEDVVGLLISSEAMLDLGEDTANTE